MELNIFKGYEKMNSKYPTKEIEYAIANQEEAVHELLSILDHTVRNAKKLSRDLDYRLHIPAIYLLAYFKETRAFDDMIKILHLPEEILYDLVGEFLTDDMGKILASVCDGNVDVIKEVIEDTKIDDFVREEALYSLLVLMNMGILSRDQVFFYFKELFNGKLAFDYSSIWDVLPECCALIHPKGLKEDIEKATKKNEMMALITDFNQIDRQMKKSISQVLDELKKNPGYRPISKDDVYYLSTWVGMDWEEYDDEGYEGIGDFMQNNDIKGFMDLFFADDIEEDYEDYEDYEDDEFDEDDDIDNISIFDPDKKK